MRVLLHFSFSIAIVAATLGASFLAATAFDTTAAEKDDTDDSRTASASAITNSEPTNMNDWPGLELEAPPIAGHPPELVNVYFFCKANQTPLNNIIVTQVVRGQDGQFVEYESRESGFGPYNKKPRNVVPVPSNWMFRVTISGTAVGQIMSFAAGVSRDVVLSCGRDGIAETEMVVSVWPR